MEAESGVMVRMEKDRRRSNDHKNCTQSPRTLSVLELLVWTQEDVSAW